MRSYHRVYRHSDQYNHRRRSTNNSINGNISWAKMERHWNIWQIVTGLKRKLKETRTKEMEEERERKGKRGTFEHPISIETMESHYYRAPFVCFRSNGFFSQRKMVNIQIHIHTILHTCAGDSFHSLLLLLLFLTYAFQFCFVELFFFIEKTKDIRIFLFGTDDATPIFLYTSTLLYDCII